MQNNFDPTSWAIAIYDLSLETKKLKKNYQDVLEIKQIFDENPQLIAILKSFQLPSKEKAKIIKKIFPSIDKMLANFLNLLANKKLIFGYQKIFVNFIELAQKNLKIESGIIYSVSKLSQTKLKSFEKEFSNQLNLEVKLTNKIDYQLLAGASVHLQGKIYENSITYQLESIKQELLKGDK